MNQCPKESLGRRLMLGGIVGKHADGELFKGKWTRYARGSNGFQGANMFQRFGQVPSGLSGRRDPDGGGESAGRFIDRLLIQGRVERREARNVWGQARRRRLKLTALAGNDLKRRAVPTEELFQIEAALRVVLVSTRLSR